MCHQVAAIRPRAEERVKPHPPTGAGQIGDRRREPGEELQVNAGIDAPPPDLGQAARATGDHGPG